ncbi:MAG: 16S rRNA (uracil(1498)-N(3))-methyltransferase [Elusimicrobia bacterium]|nr:16S rRNA (uracil(1498)-N(3))-methyltransferase [Elusimicrobiota bacterium]
MPQFFLPPASRRELVSPGAAGGAEEGRAWRAGDGFTLTGPEAYHITKVLRYKEGHSVELFDGKGGRYTGVIRKVYEDGVDGEVTGTVESPHPGPKVRLNLYQGLLKASRWEFVLEKGTEIGVSTFIPVTTSRTVVLLREEERIHNKIERWGKIVMASAKQCRRADLPTIQSPVPLRDALKTAAEDGPILFAWEKMAGSSAKSTVREALHAALKDSKDSITVSLFIGPEGGFHDEEVDLAEVHGATLFALGSNTLRAETASLAAAALIFYELGAL